jgi:hypothetical protein
VRWGLAEERWAPPCISIRRTRPAPTEARNPGSRLAFIVKNFLKRPLWCCGWCYNA